MTIHIDTPRFYMREFLPTDVADIFMLDTDPEVHRYLGKNPITRYAQAEEIVEDVMAQYERNGIGRWAVIEKTNGEFVGWSGLKLEDMIRDEPYYDIGYRLKRKFWRQGFGYDSAQVSLDHGFEKLGYEDIYGGADVENIGSNKILKKIGLHWKEVFPYKGCPINWYGLSRDEWLSRKGDLSLIHI